MSGPVPPYTALDVLLSGLPCTIRFKRGWRCVRTYHPDGPCALVPRRWNVGAFARRYRRSVRRWSA